VTTRLREWAPDGTLIKLRETDEEGRLQGEYLDRQLTGAAEYMGGESGVYADDFREGEWLGWGPSNTNWQAHERIPHPLVLADPETLQARVNYRRGRFHGLQTYYDLDGTTVLEYRCVAGAKTVLKTVWWQKGPGPAPACDPDAPEEPRKPESP